MKEEKAPDGGWGWMVVAASFMAHVIADGCGFSFGVLFSELLEVFGESKSTTAWIGSLFVSVPAICGPIASMVANSYGCRTTTILGGFIAALGCFAASYANSIGELCLSFGIVAGFGLSMVFVPAVVVVAFYFEKKRAFATGIAVAGSGIGTTIFAPLTELLLERYQWRGTLLIISAIMLNTIVCGAIFRPLAAETAVKRERRTKKEQEERERFEKKEEESEEMCLVVVERSRSGRTTSYAQRIISKLNSTGRLIRISEASSGEDSCGSSQHQTTGGEALGSDAKAFHSEPTLFKKDASWLLRTRQDLSNASNGCSRNFKLGSVEDKLRGVCSLTNKNKRKNDNNFNKKNNLNKRTNHNNLNKRTNHNNLNNKTTHNNNKIVLTSIEDTLSTKSLPSLRVNTSQSSQPVQRCWVEGRTPHQKLGLQTTAFLPSPHGKDPNKRTYYNNNGATTTTHNNSTTTTTTIITATTTNNNNKNNNSDKNDTYKNSYTNNSNKFVAITSSFEICDTSDDGDAESGGGASGGNDSENFEKEKTFENEELKNKKIIDAEIDYFFSHDETTESGDCTTQCVQGGCMRESDWSKSVQNFTFPPQHSTYRFSRHPSKPNDTLEKLASFQNSIENENLRNSFPAFSDLPANHLNSKQLSNDPFLRSKSFVVDSTPKRHSYIDPTMAPRLHSPQNRGVTKVLERSSTTSLTHPCKTTPPTLPYKTTPPTHNTSTTSSTHTTSTTSSTHNITTTPVQSFQPNTRQSIQTMKSKNKLLTEQTEAPFKDNINSKAHCISLTTSPPQQPFKTPHTIKRSSIQSMTRTHLSKHNGLSDSDRCVFLAARQNMVYRGSLLRAGFFSRHVRSASCPEVCLTPRKRSRFRQKQGLWCCGEVFSDGGGSTSLNCSRRSMSERCGSIVDFSVFRSPVFSLFNIHTILLYLSYDIPYLYGPNRATLYGIEDRSASYLVSIIGIFSMFGQVLMGYLGDQPFLNVTIFYNVMTAIAGLFVTFMPLTSSFPSIATFHAGYGFFISANFALTTVILVELLGMQRLTNAFGIVSMSQGIANLLGPPIAGWLSDVTGSYDMAFYGSGVIIVLSGLILFMAPWLERYDSRDYGEHGNEDEEGGEGGEGGERRRQKKEGKNKNIRKNKKKDTGLNGVVIVNGSVSEGRPVEVVAERD